MNWVKCSERLPEEFEKVLVYDEELGINSLEVVEYRSEFNSNFYGYIDPTYWIKLKDITLPIHKCQSKCKLCDAREEWNKE